ncbi:MAG: carboxypeptidase regulatory-like domain-containing protein [Deltaproteobacteria bacterium]|nr:carboxypeptidase regulatory-like domain-containing protein [Deltaproteobacteria bacterium]MBK8713471.1 carboxypeptidase regulatory-like domain-containing protein [Deltaproteobacteria bacterium]MBP7288096.1 carboxypeptidase regulatory-like domain-containing protein [Nannocystaceae bacterium]
MGSKRWIVVVVALVLALGGALTWFFVQHGRDEGAGDGTEGGVSDRARIVAEKHAARARGEVDIRTGSVSGRITAVDGGKPIAGAVVILTPKGMGDLSGQPRGRMADPLVARTDAGGGWRIEPVPPGRYTLGASAKGFLPGRIGKLDVAAAVDNGGHDLQLVAGGVELRGTVSDIGGGPVDGALVQITRTDEGNMLDFSRAPAAVFTDDEGHFVAHVPLGSFAVHAAHPEYVADTKNLEVAGPRSIEFVLTPGATIAGVVRTLPDGAPLAGALVTIGDADDSGFGIDLGGARVLTDDGGNFELRGLASGVHAVMARSGHYASAEPVEVAVGVAEQVSGVEIWVDRAYTISGFVVRRGEGDGEPLEGVLLGGFSLQPSALYVASSPSAQDGYFEILGVQPGNYMIGAVGEETLPNITGTSAQVVDADVNDVLVVMDPGVAIRGRVQPPTLANVRVVFDGEGMGLSGILTAIGNAMLRSRTEADGSFTLAPVASGKLKLVVDGDDGSHGELPVEVGAADLEGVVVELTARPSVGGIVNDAHGKPVAGVTVAMRSQAKQAGGGFNIDFNGGSRQGQHEATTAEDGRFIVRGVEPGRYDLMVEARALPLAWATPDDPASPSAPRDLEVDARGIEGLALQVEARDGVLRGSVVDEQGVPAADAWVTATREGETPFNRFTASSRERTAEEADDTSMRRFTRGFGAERPVLTDEQGHFEITGLRAGTYALEAEGDKGGARVRVEGVALGSSTKLQLDALGVISGTVRSSKPLEGLSVKLEGPVSRTKSVRDKAGAFRFDRLDPGHYELVAESKQGTAKGEVDLEEGKTATVTLEIRGWGKLRGLVVDGTGEPVAGLNVIAVGDGAVNSASMFSMFTGGGPRTDARGRFELDEVPPGDGNLTFVDPDDAGAGAAAEVKYHVDGGAEADLGTITAVRTAKVPVDERGDLGLRTRSASWSKRPRAKGAKDDREAPDEADHLWVFAVDIGGPAEAAGVEPGDEIVAIDGQQVSSLGAGTAARLLSRASVRDGQSVRLELDRAGSGQSATIVAKPFEKRPGPPR